jgi:hypothetical protein
MVSAHHQAAGFGGFGESTVGPVAAVGEPVLVGVSVVDEEHCPLEFGGLEDFRDRLGLPAREGYGLRMLLFPDAVGSRRRITLVTTAVESVRAAAAAWADGAHHVLPPVPPAGTVLAVQTGWPTAFVPVPAVETLFDLYDFFEPWSLNPGTG